MVHIAAKNSSKPHLDDTGKPFYRHPPLLEEEKEVLDMIQSPMYANLLGEDLVLVREAEVELDRRAARIPHYEERARRFDAMQSLAARECAEAPPCYWNDAGCGYRCIDRLEPRLKTIEWGG